MSATSPRPKVLISGASIAGPALARWLGRNGFAVTVVEKASSIRPGGQAVDFKGPTHMRLLHAMGVYDGIYAARTALTDWRVVDAHDAVQAVIPGEFLGGNLEILRGDLAAVLHAASKDDAEYIFGDEIRGMEETRAGVDVRFAHRPPERFDLVFGADGVHSAVRRLAFGPEEECITNMGYYYAVAGAPLPLDDLETTRDDGRAVAYMYNEPDRMAVLGGQKAPSLFVFRARVGEYDRKSPASQRAFLRDHFDGCGWRVPRALEAIGAQGETKDTEAPSDFYMDALVRTRLTKFSRGRVALLGDAGYANTLGGFGSGLALMGAYVLAGELVRNLKTTGDASDGWTLDYAAAFAEYDRIMEKGTGIARSGEAGSFLAPPSWWRIRMRNWMFANSWTTGAMIWLGSYFATDENLPTYELV